MCSVKNSNQSLLSKCKKIYGAFTPNILKNYINFYRTFKRFPSLKNSKYFNEKILYRKIFDRNFLYTYCSDKLLVRNYISRKIGGEYLIPLIAVMDEPEDLRNINDFSNTVIKPNHGAGMVKIVGNNNLTSNEIEDLISQVKLWMKIDFSEISFEPHYKNIERKIIVEKSICENDIAPIDYKFHCFKQKNDSIKTLLQVIGGRFGDNGSQEFYLDNLENCIRKIGCKTESSLVPKEHHQLLLKAMELNKVLSQDFNYVRIDWYISNGYLYFGELTFTSGAGLSVSFGDDLEKLMSEWWVL
ncbi:ATP-grasp fold amidoligase family protein [Providencia hangzhouensis]|nr:MULTISPECIES: ATP-grasp fold amidoligase family protein [Providencia]ELR5266656.1 hypothetical protein [Providencia rettgeri]MBJ9970235.1 hypothetical protein [Providencia rettgeri]MCF8962598.1 hypothetical protein [Providencia rettgeri]MDE8748235.1 ATP-grasp fold amidoligase family protein [Providencia thailandensis]MDE8767614.1 ATP-grasp fold amidoligase family protein [Providencia thailandensis]